MSRHDIKIILERLSLDHRTSLCDKANAYLHAVEYSGMKNHPSHAAICIDIAADQYVKVSRQALVRFSGAASPSDYSNALQTISRILAKTGKAVQTSSSSHNHSIHTPSQTGSNSNSNSSSSTRLGHMEKLLSSTSKSYLRQLAVQRGSIELVGLVMECLELFFESWVKSLPPAQRVHVNYSDAKWVGAAFWLCAMARGMKADTKRIAAARAGTIADKAAAAAASKVKRIGGRGGKELKDQVLMTVEHKVKKTELENTIKLIEDTVQDYLASLRQQPKGGAGAAATAAAATAAAASRVTAGLTPPLTPRKRKSSNNSDSSTSLADIVIPMRGGVEARRITNQDRGPTMIPSSSSSSSSLEALTTESRVDSRHADRYQSISNKRQISNVSQLSLGSEEEPDGEQDSRVVASMERPTRATKPPSKRTKLDSQNVVSMSSSGIMASSKGSTRKGLKESTAASQDISRLLRQKRNIGGVYSMIPRVKYVNTKAFAQYQEWKVHILKALASTAYNDRTQISLRSSLPRINCNYSSTMDLPGNCGLLHDHSKTKRLRSKAVYKKMAEHAEDELRKAPARAGALDLLKVVASNLASPDKCDPIVTSDFCHLLNPVSRLVEVEKRSTALDVECQSDFEDSTAPTEVETRSPLDNSTLAGAMIDDPAST
ncbi:hypothetical protein EDD11_006309 [Mortierella claussenii]|nr:hypothetical protein EDD11_006309 [Mortierella claussenii]